MVNLQKIDDSSVKFVFTDSDHYLVGNGEIVVPINSLSLVIDESEMVTFKKSATGDPFISFRADNSNLGTKEAIEQFYKENMVGAGGISQEEVQDMIDSSMSGVPSSQVVEQLRTDVNTISGNTYTKTQIDGFLSNAEGMLTTISGEVQTNAANIADIWDTIDEKEEVIASALTEVRQDVNKKASVYYVDFWALFNDSFEMDDAKWNEMVEAYNNNAIFYAIPNDDFNNAAIPLMVEYSAIDNYFWFNVSYGNGYASLSLNRIDGRDGYEYEVSDPTEYYIDVDNQLNGGSTNPVQNAVITQALDAKADASALTSIESSITAVSNDLNTLSGAVIDNEYTVSQSLNDLNSRKLDISAYTPTDLSQYWTSAQTQSAIDEAKAYYVDFAAMSVQGITDADWDGLVAAINAHRPILVKVGTANGYVNATTAGIFDNTIIVTGADEGNASKYTFTKNGSNDYSVSTSTKVFVSQTEKDAWNAKQDALTAGSGIEISGNVISAIGGGVTVDQTLDSGSTNPVANSAITTAINAKQNRINSAYIVDNLTFSTLSTSYHKSLSIGRYNTVNGGVSSSLLDFASINGNGIVGVNTDFSLVETSAITSSITSTSTDDEIPSAKAVYDTLGGLKLVKLTQAEYDALEQAGTLDSSTLYIVSNVVS